jgi:hypothetical protein
VPKSHANAIARRARCTRRELIAGLRPDLSSFNVMSFWNFLQSEDQMAVAAAWWTVGA